MMLPRFDNLASENELVFLHFAQAYFLIKN